VVQDEASAFPADGGQSRGRFVMDVGEHEAFVGWGFVLCVRGVQDLVDPGIREGEFPDHVSDLGGKSSKVGELPRLVGRGVAGE